MKRILIVRWSAIGDCVLAAHLATSLRRNDPEAFIAWTVETRCVPVLDSERMLSKIVPIPRSEWKERRWSPACWREQMRTYTGLRKFKFDVGLDLHGHSKTALCLRLSGSRVRHAVRATDAFARLLNPLLKLPEHGPHEIDLYGAALKAVFGLEIDKRPIMPDISVEEAAVRSDLGPEPFITIQTGAGFEDKRYPATLWAQAAEKVNQKVVAIGSPTDPRIPSDSVVDRIGHYDLRMSMAAVKLSQAHLSADTGTAHIAAAFDVPTLTVFGRTEVERFHPWSDRGITLKRSNRPSDVPVDEVVAGTMRLLENDVSAVPDR